MFTGLIREVAKVDNFSNNFLTLRADYRPKTGDSVAINGACLTVVKVAPPLFTVELSPESISILAIENYRDRVHIEPAMQMGERFEGHVVQGHIDATGVVKSINKNSNSWDFYISIPKEQMRFMIPKGSISVDGISLTINDVLKESVRLTIIPHTINETLFTTYKSGRKVNIESDMFARYIFHLFKKGEKNSMSWQDIEQISSLY